MCMFEHRLKISRRIFLENVFQKFATKFYTKNVVIKIVAYNIFNNFLCLKLIQKH
jgi:hypothetical protein